jgi:hypothetical protein
MLKKTAWLDHIDWFVKRFPPAANFGAFAILPVELF